jgi:hypothetical protein
MAEGWFQGVLMPVFSCPGCNQLYEYAESDNGRPFVCPQCRTQGYLPRDGEVELVTPASPAEWHAACPRCSSALPLAWHALHRWVRCPVCHLFFVARQTVAPAPTDIPISPPPAPSFSHRTSNRTLVGGLLLAGGICAILNVVVAILCSVFLCCFWPGVYLALGWSIVAIVRGSQMLSMDDHGPPPRLLAILQVLLIINLDVVNLVLGIVNLASLEKW